MTVCVWLTNAAVIVVRDVSVHLKVRRAVKDLAERFRVLRQPIDVRLNVEIQLQSQSICQKKAGNHKQREITCELTPFRKQISCSRAAEPG